MNVHIQNTEQFKRGQADKAAGKPRHYGCHFGMRSTLEQDRADYYRGWDYVLADVPSPIDALGQIKAEIAALEAIEAQLREQIIALGNGKHEGVLFNASVSTTERERVDYKTICAKLKPSRQMLQAHTSSQEVITVRVASR